MNGGILFRDGRKEERKELPPGHVEFLIFIYLFIATNKPPPHRLDVVIKGKEKGRRTELCSKDRGMRRHLTCKDR